MLQTIGLTKSFGNVHALKGVNIEIRPGEVVGLVGENGAGKSTLMRIFAGVQQPTSGELRRDGAAFRLTDPRDAGTKGIGMVFQEQSLLLNLSVAENLFLGQEEEFIRFGLMNWRKLNTAARHQLQKVGLDVDPSKKASELSFAARQMVELAKALALEDRVERDLVILLDEPTSVLEQAEIDIYTTAIGAGEPAAWASGIRVNRQKIIALALCGLLAALAGLLLAGRLSSGSPTLANQLLLPAIAAVIVGGTAITGGIGGIGRTLIGALIISVVRIGMTFLGVNIFAQQIVFGAVLVAAVAGTIDRSKIPFVK